MKHIVTTTQCTPYTRYPPLVDVPTAVLRRRGERAAFSLIVAKERRWQHRNTSLHWFFFRNKISFSEIKKHQPQLFHIKKIPQIPFPNTRPRHRRQQVNCGPLRRRDLSMSIRRCLRAPCEGSPTFFFGTPIFFRPAGHRGVRHPKSPARRGGDPQWRLRCSQIQRRKII
jgi:hypothetical protein